MSKNKYENSLIDEITDEIVSGNEEIVEVSNNENEIPEDQQEVFGKFNRHVPVNGGEVENGSTTIKPKAPTEILPIDGINNEHHDHNHDQIEEQPQEEIVPPSPEEKDKPDVIVTEGPQIDEELVKTEMAKEYEAYLSVDGLGQLAIPKTMTLYEIYKEFVTHRFHFVGLTKEEDYKHISEYLNNNNIKYLNLLVPKSAIKQFLTKLKTNTDYIIKRKLKTH